MNRPFRLVLALVVALATPGLAPEAFAAGGASKQTLADAATVVSLKHHKRGDTACACTERQVVTNVDRDHGDGFAMFLSNP